MEDRCIFLPSEAQLEKMVAHIEQNPDMVNSWEHERGWPELSSDLNKMTSDKRCHMSKDEWVQVWYSLSRGVVSRVKHHKITPEKLRPLEKKVYHFLKKAEMLNE